MVAILSDNCHSKLARYAEKAKDRVRDKELQITEASGDQAVIQEI